MSIAPSSELFQQYKERDCQVCFNELYERHSQQLIKWLRRRFDCLSRDQVEDVSQATWCAVCSQDRTQFVRQFKPWLFCIATHEALALIQANRPPRFVTMTSLQSLPFESDVLREFLATLTPAERPTFLLVYCLGMTLRQTARCLGCMLWRIQTMTKTIRSKISQSF